MIHPAGIEKLYTKLYQAMEQGGNPFPEKGKIDITCKHGVYIIFKNNKKVLHVGRTLRNKNGLCQRLNDHINNASSFSKKFLKNKGSVLREKQYRFAFIEVAHPVKRAFLEALATGKLCPAHIGTGAESILNR